MPSQDHQIVVLLKRLNDRLEALSAQVEILESRLSTTDSVSDGLSTYPNQFITPKEALPFLKLRSTQGVYAACRSGQFKLGTELIDISPQGSDRPTYLINPYAYFKRLQEEQRPLAG